MVISVLTLGGILLSAAGIAGLLTTYQIRAANDAVNSAKAFFAADAGIEAASYCLLKILDCTDPENYVADNLSLSDAPQVFASVTSVQTSNSLDIFSNGYAAAGKVVRTLQASFYQPAP
ncbi:MAG: hypothetical protein UY23_C0001G0293 [Candidatus Jorgensenbacteria bacterium GW2011_GWA1_48_11]|uniref:Type 4 fimbrial biogenesis protein PilX N-terminal domain-containing protein n=1 Tax=Candidatus Jorgensenbacteria bacterium GW2011_GWA1_48_11 TaxID=1618660 RepID=A0A0G1UC37_9BACT|nr:MAG: hypothetical protein UY23_C0001G0293 [Candidatus Jorgensenbacteria bacterium GW2011_GWA1_48_11]KKW12178.1 MAG: hypothetical protein UY51_C0005G0420 [Candidatus Jorgensenbacteria bacterium GW2011_GWB1_49_9]